MYTSSKAERTTLCHGTNYPVPWHEVQCAMARTTLCHFCEKKKMAQFQNTTNLRYKPTCAMARSTMCHGTKYNVPWHEVVGLFVPLAVHVGVQRLACARSHAVAVLWPLASSWGWVGTDVKNHEFMNINGYTKLTEECFFNLFFLGSPINYFSHVTLHIFFRDLVVSHAVSTIVDVISACITAWYADWPLCVFWCMKQRSTNCANDEFARECLAWMFFWKCLIQLAWTCIGTELEYSRIATSSFRRSAYTCMMHWLGVVGSGFVELFVLVLKEVLLR